MNDGLREKLADSIEGLVLIELLAAMEAGKSDAAATLIQRALEHAEQGALDVTDMKVICMALKNINEGSKALQVLNPAMAKTRSRRPYAKDKAGYLVVQKYSGQGQPLSDNGAFSSAAGEQHVSVKTAKDRYYGYREARNEWLVPIIKKVLLLQAERLKHQPERVEAIIFYLKCLLQTVEPFGVTKRELLRLVESTDQSGSD